MKHTDDQAMLLKNQQEYAETYASMKWLTTEGAGDAMQIREQLVHDIFKEMDSRPGWQFSNTKLFTHSISPGCSLCGQGDWSCLFINGICNARCFYCPSSQKDMGAPMTNTLEFKHPGDYAAYINQFNIKGVSFSGGEPFLTFDRVIAFLKALRAKVDHPLYIWMYTNGLLVTDDKLRALKDNGLDEIRFDISANQYILDALKKAVGVIPRVTVEIPAIPEDLERMKTLLPELADAGVNHLNLHQLRCTPYNSANLMQRNYTFIHGPKVTVLETELTALELIRYSLEADIDLPINYCSFTYRNQFQGAGARKRYGLKIKAGNEDMTQTGHIRSMSLHGERETIGAICRRLSSRQADPTLWNVSSPGDQLSFSFALWEEIDFSNTRLKVAYSTSAVKPAISYRYPFKEIKLSKNKKLAIERYRIQPGIWLDADLIDRFGRLIRTVQQGIDPELTGNEILDGVLAFEVAVPGLAPYF